MDPRLGVNVAQTLSDNYPERLSKILLIDAPRTFEPIFKLVSSDFILKSFFF